MAWQDILGLYKGDKSKMSSVNLPGLLDDEHLSLFRFPPLLKAYLYSSRDAFKTVLSMTPRSAVNDVDVTGNTVLSWAVMRGDSKSVEQLLLCGSDPGHVDSLGQTLLHQAILGKDVNSMQLFLDAKVDVNLRNYDGATAINLAAGIKNGTKSMDLLLSRGAIIESQTDEGWRSLHRAAFYNASTNLQFLLEKGANINAATKLGVTALMLGVTHNSHDALRLLLCDKALDCDARNHDGNSVLFYAACYGDLETLHLLHSSGRMKEVDLDDTALEIAEWRRDDNETYSSLALIPPDEDPQAWYSAFEALWNSIVDAQEDDREWDSDASSAGSEKVQTEEEDVDDDDEEENDEDDDDDDDDPEMWKDAPESPDRPTQ